MLDESACLRFLLMRTACFDLGSGALVSASLAQRDGMKSVAAVCFSVVRKPVFAIQLVSWPNRSSRASISIRCRLNSASS